MSDRIMHFTFATLRRRAINVAAAGVAGAIVIAVTSGAISTQAVEAHEAARAAAVTRIGTIHVEDAAALRQSTSAARSADAASVAATEVARAEAVLASSAGKAAETGRTALAASIASVKALSGSSAYRLLGAVMNLRESEKAVTDSVAAWEAAEQQRLAAAAAARAAAAAAAEYTSVHHTVTRVTTRTTTVSSASSNTPGASPTPPDNSGCGPCPGATLVLTQSGYWGCP